MAFFSGIYRYRKIQSLSAQSNLYGNSLSSIFLYPYLGTQWFSTDSDSATRMDFPGENAYRILEVAETSSFQEIKASFRKLAKETHPDLAQFKSDSSASKRFVQILAAYEILSDSKKRAHYDRYLLSQRQFLQQHSGQGPILYTYESDTSMNKQMEVVEWLKWYRLAINNIVSERKAVVGTGYFDVLEADFYAAINAAYYGPEIESMDLLPDRFEAEERSVYENPEVLHLVSGRNLFGMVCLVNGIPKLPYACHEKLASFSSVGSFMHQSTKNASICTESGKENSIGISEMQIQDTENDASDAYKDLELHVCGRVIAMAIRVPPKSSYGGIHDEDAQDHIHVFLASNGESVYNSKGFSGDCFPDVAVGSRILLGTITGLGTSPEEGSCFVYDSNGTKTHVIMKHRTLLVKHMHWYPVGEKVSVCECRCCRARLPPSKFWLFEPRCSTHDIGGWYIETFGKDKKGRTVPSQRYWDGFDANKQFDERLHPAMYLLALAYRTLDIEDAKRKKKTIRDIIEGSLFRIFSWCKKLA
ncbi:hypothetical protein SLEP1_g8282 [Rubroshorea leprosula]|uniref:J domain-containing protein n=1 Tax=Rubroshorea leprosula TaxID=152421 RepID=A0AAV5IAG2_9ROSI|nr:hypothetical protein SLEP1_g8282 [Rubroshorea leprosula]